MHGTVRAFTRSLIREDTDSATPTRPRSETSRSSRRLPCCSVTGVREGLARRRLGGRASPSEECDSGRCQGE